ncbi:hypothetical protein JST99_02480 [Candidatus Dependentiae bacterium]|nr:hypothetical protein [Candidatus Dependentiae bacterium]
MLGLTPITDASEDKGQTADTYILRAIKNDPALPQETYTAFVGRLIEQSKLGESFPKEACVYIFEPSNKTIQAIQILYFPADNKGENNLYKPEVFKNSTIFHFYPSSKRTFLSTGLGWTCSKNPNEPVLFTAELYKPAIAQALTQSAPLQSKKKVKPKKYNATTSFLESKSQAL